MRSGSSGRGFEGALDSDDEAPELENEPSEDSDLDAEELPCTDEDESHWDAFIPDEDERDPEPEAGDFWMEWNEELNSES